MRTTLVAYGATALTFLVLDAIWLSSIGNQPQDNFTVASRLAAAAEPYARADEPHDAQQTALNTVALLKRNMLFFLVLVSILTIVHWLP
jgi:AmpE protein